MLLTNLNPNRITATIGIPIKRKSHVANVSLKIESFNTYANNKSFWNKTASLENKKEKNKKGKNKKNGFESH